MTAEEINSKYKKDQDRLIKHYGGVVSNNEENPSVKDESSDH